MENQLTVKNPTDIISQAVASGANIETLEKLMALKERYDKEEARKAFFVSLAEFQENAPDIRKTKTVAFKETKYAYAPLADIDRQIKQSMKECSLTKRWEIKDSGEDIEVNCIITHINGHSECTSMRSKADTSGSKNPIQARGSAIEYMKRYTLIGALGLTTADTDVDGRLPELDVDKLHKQYMEVYSQIIQKDSSMSSSMNPDNWAVDRTAKVYIAAIGKAREILSKLSNPQPK
jgi:hypothetical protein